MATIYIENIGDVYINGNLAFSSFWQHTLNYDDKVSMQEFDLGDPAQFNISNIPFSPCGYLKSKAIMLKIISKQKV